MSANAETGDASARGSRAGGYPGRILAVDYGEKRVGLALSDPSRTIASPAGFIVRRAGKRPPIAEIVRRAEAAEATAFVIGLPLDDRGDDTPRATETRQIAAELEKRTGLPVTLVDERYTTSAPSFTRKHSINRKTFSCILDSRSIENSAKCLSRIRFC